MPIVDEQADDEQRPEVSREDFCEPGGSCVGRPGHIDLPMSHQPSTTMYVCGRKTGGGHTPRLRRVSAAVPPRD